ncbi:MAG: hypothetical protein IJ794_09135 [Lachnospiraceae bacterium]|nr:hypothetical protein [Lachnospiraceae bacterium]
MSPKNLLKRTLRTSLILLIELCILVALYLGTMTITCSYSNAAILQNIEDGLQIIAEEGDYPSYFYGEEGAKLDNFTDRIILQHADIVSDQPLISALFIRGYSRYWHGYLIFVKLLLNFMGLFQIRKLIMIFLGTLFAASLYFICRRFGAGAAFAYLAMWLEYYSACVAGSFQFFWCYAIMYMSVILLIVFYHPEKQSDTKFFNGSFSTFVILLFFAIGSFTNFVDFLTFPLVTLTLPLTFFLLTEIFYAKSSIPKILGRSILLSIIWSLGYGLTWISKWLLSAVLLPGNIFYDVKKQIMFRMNGNEQYPISRWGVITLNLSHPYFLKHTMPMVVLLLVAVAWNIRKKETRTKLLRLLPIVPILFYPYLWYEFMCNHSIIHNFFTYRAQMGTSFCLYFLIIVLLIPGAVKNNDNT